MPRACTLRACVALRADLEATTVRIGIATCQHANGEKIKPYGSF